MYTIELGIEEVIALEDIYHWALFSKEVEGIKYFEVAEFDALLTIFQQLVQQGYEPTLRRITKKVKGE